jgi:hypothetical protein
MNSDQSLQMQGLSLSAISLANKQQRIVDDAFFFQESNFAITIFAQGAIGGKDFRYKRQGILYRYR